MEIRKDMHELPQTGIPANQLLKKILTKNCKVPHRLGLWKHHKLPIQFTLVVNDFGIRSVNKQDAEHLLNAHIILKQDIDWTKSRFCGITIEWKYKDT